MDKHIWFTKILSNHFCGLLLVGNMALASVRNTAVHKSLKQVEQAWDTYLFNDLQALSLCYNALEGRGRTERDCWRQLGVLALLRQATSSFPTPLQPPCHVAPLVQWSLQRPHRHPTLASASRSLVLVHHAGGSRSISLSQNLTDSRRPLTTVNRKLRSGMVQHLFRGFEGGKRHPKRTHIPSSLHFEAALPFQASLSPRCPPPKAWLHKVAWEGLRNPLAIPTYPSLPPQQGPVLLEMGSALRGQP